MPCHTRMKIIFLQGLLWLYLLNFNIVHSAIEPGYLDFDNLPDTNFSCVGKVIGGYYADLETNCQMFHVCTIGQLDEPMDIRFLCLNGTVFDQETRVCERVDEVDCSKSERFYHLNLELYGNTAPPILEDSDATKPPIISSTPSSATTTRSTTTIRTTKRSFYTTSIPTIPPTTHATPKVITSNQFPVHSGPDIRFNPEEINIRLTPGSPPIIKSPSVSFQQQSFNGDSRISVTTHTSVFQDERTSQKNQPSTSSTQKPKSIVSYGLQHGYQQQQPYDYAYQQTENSDLDYHTDLPSSEYSYQEDNEQFESGKNYETTHVNTKQQVFSASTTKVSETSPSSTSFPSSIKPPQAFNYQRTDKPPNLQLPVPGFPTLPPLTFSSPAPFSLQRHFEQKRSNDHQQRPRIIVSASASVSDASGRRLNYSLGTIGTSHIIGKAPRSYDDYKEGDVGLDPFYHDVPKVNKPRQKREVEDEEEKREVEKDEEEKREVEEDEEKREVDEDEEEKREVEEDEEKREVDEEEDNIAKEETSAENHTETVHWTPPEYVDDNYEPFTYNHPENNTITSSDNNTTASAEADIKNTTESSVTTTEQPEYEYYDYVDDNYEPSMYETGENGTDIKETENLHNTSLILTSTESSTEPSHETVSQETTIEANTVTESMDNAEHTEMDQSTPYTEYISTTLASIYTEEPSNTEETHTKEVDSEDEAIAEKSVDPGTEEEIVNSETKHTFEENEERLETINNNNDKSINHENEHTEDKLVNIENKHTEEENEERLEETINEDNESEESKNHEENIGEKSVDSENENNKDEIINDDDNEDIQETTVKQHTAIPDVNYEETTTEINTEEEHGRNIQSENHESEQVTTEYTTEAETVPSEHYSHEDTTLPTITESPTIPNIVETSTYITTEPTVTENSDSDSTTSVYTYITNRQTVSENEHEELTTELPTEKYADHFITTQTTPEPLPETTTEMAITTERAETTLDLIEHPTTTESFVTTEGLKDETDISEDTQEESTTIKETTTEIITSTAKTTTSTTRYSYLRTREPYYKRYSRTRPTSRHRFSSPTIHMSPSLLKLHGNKLAAQIPSTTSSEVEENKSTEDISSSKSTEDTSRSKSFENLSRFKSFENLSRSKSIENTSRSKSTEDVSRSKSTEDKSRSKSIENTSRLNRRIDKQPELSIQSDDVSLTDAPLSKSANPTEPKDTKVSSPLPTTPITKTYFIPRRFSYDSSRSFNCIGKKMNKFYEDPRDCRLFHYCTPGYSETQVLDMKFVCDFGTYFDSAKLICTKVKPQRCK